MPVFEVQQLYSRVWKDFHQRVKNMEVLPVDLDEKVCLHRFVHKLQPQRKCISKPDVTFHLQFDFISASQPDVRVS